MGDSKLRGKQFTSLGFWSCFSFISFLKNDSNYFIQMINCFYLKKNSQSKALLSKAIFKLNACESKLLCIFLKIHHVKNLVVWSSLQVKAISNHEMRTSCFQEVKMCWLFEEQNNTRMLPVALWSFVSFLAMHCMQFIICAISNSTRYCLSYFSLPIVRH